MSAYRLYCLDDSGHISVAEWIEAVDDEDAARKAREIDCNALKCEVWQGERLVAKLDAQDLSG
jgi:hypothetical protein